MSLIHSESFIAFDPTTVADDFNADGTAMRNAVAANLRRAGYLVEIQTQAAVGTSSGWAIRTDPVAPDRVNLVFSTASTTAAGPAVGIRKVLGTQSEAIIGGFSLYIPAEFVKQATANTAALLRVNASHLADTTWSANSTAVGTAKEVFRVSPDLLVRWGTDAAMSSKALQAGRVNFLEYRISDGEVRVWLDDVLVVQKQIALTSEAIALMFDNNTVTGGTSLLGLPGRWAIGNWYNLLEDARAPNVRLGPTTRVIGVRPNLDVDVDFTQAVAAPSNAAVAAQAIVDNPANSLQSTTVGNMDVYATNRDTSTAGGAMVHAVAVKVLAANLESNAHTLRPIIRSATGVEGVDVRPRMYRTLATIGAARQLNGIARRPTDDRVFVVGQAYSLYSTPSNLASAPGTDPVWTQHADDNSANNNNGIAFRADGTGVIVRQDGKVGVLLPGSNDPVIVVPAANTNNLLAVAVLPDGRFICVGNTGTVLRSATPQDAASWVKTATPNTTLPSVAVDNVSGRIVVGTALQNTVYSSDTNGDTWVTRTPGGTATTNNYQYVTWDGSYFITQYITNAGYGRRSADGALWGPMYAANNTNGAGQVTIAFMAADPAQRMSMMGGANGVMTSKNAFDWRSLSFFAAGVSVRAAATMANGDWLIVGAAGFAALYSSPSSDIPIAPLAGYQATFNSSALNPATGERWTPAEASQAQFGMRLTS